ncbi:MAG TPA: hypothetical protein VIQ00_00170 [Chitinophagaceae bacterium]|jgi:hypothetical protein
MKKIFIPFLIFCLACNEDKEKDNTAVPSDVYQKTEAPELENGCYKMIAQNDSAFLKIKVEDSIVTGDLHYRWFEKDKNDGTIRGVIKDSLLIANYTFNSEGRSSVREVIFKIKNDTLIEGFGDISMKSVDTVKFKNISHLNFMHDRQFIKIACN